MGPHRQSFSVFLPKAWAVSCLALLLCTIALWLPFDTLPQVPWVRWAGEQPILLEALALGGWVAALLMLVAAGPGTWLERLALGGALIALVVLLAVDQLRFQPWAYQGLWVLVAWLCLPVPRAVQVLSVLIVSIYFFSAISKLDSSFVEVMGPQFLLGFARATGLAPPPNPVEPAALLPLAAGWSLLFPLTELVIALGLCWPRGRRVAVVASVVMHLMLLLILGPRGLNHQPGVLVWNLSFCVFNVLLFWPQASLPLWSWPDAKEVGRGGQAMFIGFALLSVWPSLEPLGLCDAWPAWGLYSPRNERVTLFLQAADVERLPWQLRNQVRRRQLGEPWWQVRLDRWTLDELRVPIYPQRRYQLGLVAGLIARYQLQGPFEIEACSQAARWNGARVCETFTTPAELSAALDQFFWNARPRTP